tara:strand:+ start:784 stop:900 length:117 start_codon:yes stop_codon:yes gene_type:complete
MSLGVVCDSFHKLRLPVVGGVCVRVVRGEQGSERGRVW